MAKQLDDPKLVKLREQVSEGKAEGLQFMRMVVFVLKDDSVYRMGATL